MCVFVCTSDVDEAGFWASDDQAEPNDEAYVLYSEDNMGDEKGHF